MPHRPLWLAAAIFLGTFSALQWGWSALRGTTVETWVIDRITVGSAALVIGTLDPSSGVRAAGSRLSAPGGGINVLNGCEGVEIVFLLVAAILAAPLRWRERLAGIALGSAVVFMLNQGRIIALFYAFRNDRALFDTLHGMVTPILMVVGAGVFFALWLKRCQRPANPSAAA